MKKLFTFLFAFVAVMAVAHGAMAEEAAAAAASGSSGLIALAAGICMSVAVLGGTMGQGKAASAALEGLARNPGSASQVKGQMILGLALIESLVLFGFVIAILLTNKV